MMILKNKQICVKYIPHNLTDEPQKHKTTKCEDITQICHTNPQFLYCIATADEC